MSQQHIEEIENKIFGELPFKAKAKDIKLIIEYAKEQAERAEQNKKDWLNTMKRLENYEKVASLNHEEIQRLRDQIKRYHDVIEETLESFGLIERQKYGKKLEKALESEFNE